MQLVVIGTGLMGGSFARAARRAGIFDHIIGLDPDTNAAQRAIDLGIVDAVTDLVPTDADAVLLAGPSHTIAPWVADLWGWERSPDREPVWKRSVWERSPDRESGPIVFDTGSVKSALLDHIRATLGSVPARFVPCHPLAGSEQSGPEAADENLFRNAEVIVTPAAETDPAAHQQVAQWWQAVGARVCVMTAEEHDRVLALTSHLPHLLAFSYLQLVEDGDLAHTAGGFRDFTRIGRSDARMWAPIFRMNPGALLAALGRMERELSEVRRLIEEGDEAALVAYLEDAARRRGGGE